MRVSLHQQKCLDFGLCGWCEGYGGMPYTFFLYYKGSLFLGESLRPLGRRTSLMPASSMRASRLLVYPDMSISPQRSCL